MHPVPGARVCVGRTMFETDGLPATWVEALNQLDEVWVPSAFNVETFSHAGVTAPMYVIGGGVDVSLYRPGRAPLSIEGVGKDSVVFLSIFEWTHRKAPDVLLAAWADAFGPGDPVALVLRAFPRGRFTGDVQGAVEALVDTELERLGACRDDIAPIIVLGNALGPADMPRLLGAADVFVGVSRGEGWGRPLHEAMACGLPAVATRWSGNLAFMDDDNSLLVDVDALVDIDERMDLAFYRGQHWAEPSVAHLRAILKKAALDEELRQRLGERARADIVARWQWEHVSALADARLRALVRRAGGSTHSVARSGPGARTEHRAEGREALRVRWVGDFYGDHSLATVNRELCTQLADLGTAHVQPVTTERPPYPVDNASTVSRLLRAGGAADPNGAADVEVRLSWPPDLTSSALPLVVAQPWEYGGLPERYVTGMRDVADEVWVPTTWVRDCFVRSGLDAERVAVVPLGVDTDVFCPDGDRLALESDKPLRFLFVGGALRRKGVDLLLDTYLDCFGPRDDVCLVLKLFGTYGVYQHATLGDRMRKAAADPGSAAVEVIDRRLSKAEMASLYRACDVLVHPYRGEGFGLPIAEAMACGLPTIVTAYGACLDFCDTTTSWMLPAEEVPAEVDGFGPSPIGYWVAEPDAKSLQQTLLEALVDGRLRAEKGAAARHRIEGGFSWRHSARIVAERLAALRARAARAADREA